MIKVLIADDHAVVRTGFRLLLEEAEDIEVVAEAESGEESIQLYSEIACDVVMMDIAMPGIGGIEAIKKYWQKRSIPTLMEVFRPTCMTRCHNQVH